MEPEEPTAAPVSYCDDHGQPLPCIVCERNEREKIICDLQRYSWVEHTADNNTEETKAADTKAADDTQVSAPIEPDYDPHEFEEEIGKALAEAKRVLQNGKRFVSKSHHLLKTLRLTEGQKDWDDLCQLVDIEIWKARKKYGDKWNAALAYTVARNVAGTYLGERIEEQSIPVEDMDGNPVLDEFGLERGLDGGELKRRMNDQSLTREERDEAKEKLQRYQKRIPRFASLDVKVVEGADDEDDEESEFSAAELEVAKEKVQDGRRHDNEIDWLEVAKSIPEVCELVRSWRGVKRRVADAMLEPNFTVRGVPGVSRSEASRVRQIVIREFRKVAHLKDL